MAVIRAKKIGRPDINVSKLPALEIILHSTIIHPVVTVVIMTSLQMLRY
jgi:hypothetical protein